MIGKNTKEDKEKETNSYTNSNIQTCKSPKR